MNQYNIKRIIGKICVIILIALFVCLIIGFILEAGFSTIQALCIILGIDLFVLIVRTAVYWSGL